MGRLAALRPTALGMLVTLVLAACGGPPGGAPAGGAPAPAAPDLDATAESYVRWVLALEQHDPGYVDAYYGPEAWRAEAEARPAPLEEIAAGAAAMAERLAAVEPRGSELERLRHRYLERQLAAVAARARMVAGETRSFDQESEALYDAVAPHRGEERFRETLEGLERELAEQGFSSGTLIERYDAFRQAFMLPAERLDAVFRAAIDACRRRTLEHVALPEGESFVVEYVTDKPWSAYNWYQGGYRSVIQVNTDLPTPIDRAVDLACHEGYPGHHVYNTLLEDRLVQGRGWIEYTVYPLYSPQSLIAEGSANYGIEVAFPGEERAAFERDVLFPLAGLDPARAAPYRRVQRWVEELSYAGNEAARRYLDGEIDAAAAVDWLMRYGAMSRPRAEQRLRFIEHYRSYVINYNLGRDLVRRFVEYRSGTPPTAERRWAELVALLSSPRLPSGLDPAR